MKVNNSLAFFEDIKAKTEAEWAEIAPNEAFECAAPGSKWLPGLSEEELLALNLGIRYCPCMETISFFTHSHWGELCKIDIRATHHHGMPTVCFWYPGWRKYPQMPKRRRRIGMMTKWLRVMKKKVLLQHRAMS